MPNRSANSLSHRLLAAWQLTRPVNVLIGMLSIAIGALVAGSLTPWQNVLLACLSGGLITAAANAINDYFDVEIDRINKPFRPLPSGSLSRGFAAAFAGVLFVAGVALSALINRAALLIAASASVLLYLYSARLKRTVLWGNLTVSLLSGLAFIYGGVAVFRLKIALVPAVFAFFFHLGREILKDIEDMVGDRAAEAVTFPIRHGVHASRLLITAVFSLLMILTLVPYGAGLFGRVYLWLVVLGVDAVLLFVMVSLWRDSSRENLHRLSGILKLDMLVGLLAIVAGVQWR